MADDAASLQTINTAAQGKLKSLIERIERLEEDKAAVRVLIQWAGDDPDREGLVETPARVARSYRELFAGYDANPLDYMKRTFEEVGGYDELVVLRDIPVVSFCEHHMPPV